MTIFHKLLLTIQPPFDAHSSFPFRNGMSRRLFLREVQAVQYHDLYVLTGSPICTALKSLWSVDARRQPSVIARVIGEASQNCIRDPELSVPRRTATDPRLVHARCCLCIVVSHQKKWKCLTASAEDWSPPAWRTRKRTREIDLIHQRVLSRFLCLSPRFK
jgi:hypothetical protein